MTTTKASPIRSISYGGGVQSTALLVLAAQGRIDFRTFLIANVGDDSEHPDTLAYVRHIAKPYADHHGVELTILDRRTRNGEVETLWGRLMREESRSLPIPVRMSNGAPGNRSCTADFKIRVVGKELKRRGATGGKPCKTHRNAQLEAAGIPAGTPLREIAPDNLADVDFHPVNGCSKCTPPNLATIGIGISLDEIGRANTRNVDAHERVVYPLISIGEDTGLRMRRSDCEQLIRNEPLPVEIRDQVRAAGAAGLLPPGSLRQLEASDYTLMPVPPKSSCFFCPFHKPAAWADLARERPDLFEKSAQLEDTLNDRRAKLGKDPVFLTRFNMPLREAIDTDQELLPLADGDGACDSGWCFT